jgi:hypothetical protein
VRSRAGASRSVVQDGPARVAWRLLAGFGGGYALVSAMVAAAGSVLPLAGMPRGEAVSLALLVALFVYVPACLLMIATPRPWRDGLALCGAAALLAALAISV